MDGVLALVSETDRQRELAHGLQWPILRKTDATQLFPVPSFSVHRSLQVHCLC
jgi:hypothetical protein